MRDIYAVSCDEIAGSCKNCGNLTINCGLMKKRKKSDSPKTLYSLGYSLNVKSNFLLLPMISKHTTSQKVLGIFEFSSWFISDLNGSNLQNIDELDKFCNFTKKKKLPADSATLQLFFSWQVTILRQGAEMQDKK